ncbi:hypothetical protein Bca52824_054979 [Brassica carinata]|uniref:MATH domain-containing protein n=1 Tax=Brassica carinata TaxID=52824 RepID=A0A8X7R775_BRACI|nr:hypothetical protein Bca52824_054979 [Brassica carinata]
MKLGTTQPSKTSSIAVIDSPISSDKLFDRREYWRERPPSTYCLKISSFTKLATSPNTQKYDSLPFASDGYNWTLTVYPKGNKNEDGDGQVSLYVQIDNSTLLNSPKEVYPEVKFFIYNQKEDVDMKRIKSKKTDAKRFFLFKPYWGQPRTKSYDEIANPGNGYLFDKSQILFGVDVLVTETFNKWEVFSFTENLHNRFYKWEITSFSSLEKQFYLSDEFTIGGRNW